MPGKTNNTGTAARPLTNIKNNEVKKSSPGLHIYAPVVIVAFTALLYANALQNNFTIFDDDAYILNNPFLKNCSLKGIIAIFSSFYSANYHPLTTLSWFLEYNIFGPDPVPFHLINVLLHLADTWLVYKLAERLSGNSITAAVTSILFAVHPMHVESVAWVSERKDVLYAFFYLLALLYYLRYISSGFGRRYFWYCLVLFIASLLSKSAAVTLPVLMMLIDAYKARKISIRSLAEKIPFFILSLLFGILAILSQKSGGALNNSVVSYGANSVFVLLSGLSFYIIWLLIPFKLAIMHSYPVVHNGLLPAIYYLSLPFLLVLTWLCTRRAAYRKEMLFGVLFFLVTLSVMLQLISVGLALTAERYSYVPSVGLFYIAGQWIAHMLTTANRTAVTILFTAAVAVYSLLTHKRIETWKDDSTLFNDLIEKYPGGYYGYWLRGNMEKKRRNTHNHISFTNNIKSHQKNSRFPLKPLPGAERILYDTPLCVYHSTDSGVSCLTAC